jgi:hypothetical protein
MIIDISQPLSPGMAGFPGDAAYEETQTFTIGPNCPVNVARLTLSVHCGTHADAAAICWAPWQYIDPSLAPAAHRARADGTASNMSRHFGSRRPVSCSASWIASFRLDRGFRALSAELVTIWRKASAHQPGHAFVDPETSRTSPPTMRLSATTCESWKISFSPMSNQAITN